MNRKILHQVDDDLGIQESEGLAVDELLANGFHSERISS